jgi:voltage-gated potassium channel Kch
MDFFDKDAYYQYIYSMYWSVTTMITIGYGDVVPVTSTLKIVAIIAILIASAVFGYVMNRIGVIF